MSRGSSTVLLSLLLLTAVAIALDNDEDMCVFTVYIRTGTAWKAGTDSVMSLRVYDSYGQNADISDLVSWGGLMGPFHDYFERGNLDIFSGLGSCLSGPVCAMNLTSDGSGDHHGWYCNYVEVTMSESRRKKTWGGLMGPFHDYFERGNLDIFSGLGSCLSGPVCAMNLTSDGSGDHHGWYCNYVEVTMSESRRKKSCSQEKFTVEQWLARDASPYELSAVRNHCSDFVKNQRVVIPTLM
ncbi:PREDICTED: PLAT domain-containing protein 1-like [Camelina sativa]|uniref:PLAT domain-containing protein 1-like n=1 Tax=Camelina sativa TaxID=90675 RepID=A0ABM1R9J8_CAMSA|nr:PREDICTED: PLAT domain-containing protein 1-like [Camelina sativa]